MSTTPPPPRVRPAVALAFCLVGFLALVIAGLGLVSLAADSEVVPVPGLGPLPGILGVTAAALAFAGALWPVARRARPSFLAVVPVVIVVLLAYGLVAGVAAAVVASDLAVGLAVTGGLTAGWPGLVTAGAAAVSAWSAVALVRTRAPRPRWPWEARDP